MRKLGAHVVQGRDADTCGRGAIRAHTNTIGSFFYLFFLSCRLFVNLVQYILLFSLVCGYGTWCRSSYAQYSASLENGGGYSVLSLGKSQELRHCSLLYVRECSRTYTLVGLRSSCPVLINHSYNFVCYMNIMLHISIKKKVNLSIIWKDLSNIS